MKKITSVLVATLILSACAGTPSKSDSTQAKGQAPEAGTQATMSQADIDAQKLADQLQQLKSKSVYFDFDSASVKNEYKDVVKQQADFVKAHGNDVVTVEGNCDERGSTEFNLALGEKRASAVRKELGFLGVNAVQVKVVSFGEEKPRMTCHEEKCWKENRRADFSHNLH